MVGVKDIFIPLVLNKEYDLAIDEPAPHVYTFPLFTKEFCKELIELSETKEWTNDRHEFYLYYR